MQESHQKQETQNTLEYLTDHTGPGDQKDTQTNRMSHQKDSMVPEHSLHVSQSQLQMNKLKFFFFNENINTANKSCMLHFKLKNYCTIFKITRHLFKEE